jgi:hypothetical protein
MLNNTTHINIIMFAAESKRRSRYHPLKDNCRAYLRDEPAVLQLIVQQWIHYLHPSWTKFHTVLLHHMQWIFLKASFKALLERQMTLYTNGTSYFSIISFYTSVLSKDIQKEIQDTKTVKDMLLKKTIPTNIQPIYPKIGAESRQRLQIDTEYS